MERGSDKHSARMDDALGAEVSGLIRAGHDSREDWNSPEPSGEDQPDVDLVPNGTLSGGVPDGMTEQDIERRSELASSSGGSGRPPRAAARVATSNDAPDAVLATLRALPRAELRQPAGPVVARQRRPRGVAPLLTGHRADWPFRATGCSVRRVSLQFGRTAAADSGRSTRRQEQAMARQTR
jgi:hypothetical protein